jgi:hypothetical protein
MMISFFALLVLFGGGAALIGLIVFAIASKKFWIIPVIGAFVFLGLMSLGFLVVTIPRANSNVAIEMPSATQVVQYVNGVPRTVMQSPPNVTYNGVPATPFWVAGLSGVHVLLFLILGVVLVVTVLRRIMSPHAGHAVRRAWPAVAVIIFVAVMFIGRVRTQYTVTQATSAAAATVQQAAAELAAAQQILSTHPGAHIVSQTSQQLAQSDIHEEMDKFDSPKIPISPDVRSSDVPPPTAQPPAASNHKRKKSDKTPASSDTKQSQLVAQTKPADEANAKKETTSASDKPATVAEAKFDKSTTRPAWVDQSPRRAGDTRREVIATDQYESIDECYQAIDVYLLLKTYEHLQQLAGRPSAEGPLPSLTLQNGAILADGKLMAYGRGGNWNDPDPRLRQLRDMGITADYVRREIVAKDPKNNEPREYVETVERTFGPMQKLYMQVEFTPAIDRDLLRHWDAHERRDRFAMVGVGAGSILGFIGLVFGLLKMDTWTKGYYTKRLFIGVPAAIIAGFLLLVMLVSHNATYR